MGRSPTMLRHSDGDIPMVVSRIAIVLRFFLRRQHGGGVGFPPSSEHAVSM